MLTSSEPPTTDDVTYRPNGAVRTRSIWRDLQAHEPLRVWRNSIGAQEMTPREKAGKAGDLRSTPSPPPAATGSAAKL